MHVLTVKQPVADVSYRVEMKLNDNEMRFKRVNALNRVCR